MEVTITEVQGFRRVGYRLAMKARLCGFSWPTTHYYHISDDLDYAESSREATGALEPTFYNHLNIHRCACPTFNQLAGWLAQEKGIRCTPLEYPRDGEWRGRIEWEDRIDGRQVVFSEYNTSIIKAWESMLFTALDELKRQIPIPNHLIKSEL